MDIKTWESICVLRERFKKLCDTLNETVPMLREEQQKIIDGRAPRYTVETPVVYNEALDELSIDDEIKLILVGDNPGRREQSERHYLVGPSGKIAASFFAKESALKIDFRKNVMIFNKSPIHTPRTVLLGDLSKSSPSIKEAVLESQKNMALLLGELYQALKVPIWVIGYGELRRGGIFEEWIKKIKELAISQHFASQNAISPPHFALQNGISQHFASQNIVSQHFAPQNVIENKNIFFYRHFSMNQFTIDLNKQKLKDESVKAALFRIGSAYRERIFSQV